MSNQAKRRKKNRKAETEKEKPNENWENGEWVGGQENTEWQKQINQN